MAAGIQYEKMLGCCNQETKHGKVEGADGVYFQLVDRKQGNNKQRENQAHQHKQP